MPEEITYIPISGSAASAQYVDDGWGLVALTPAGMDTARINANALRYHVDHDWRKPVGIVDTFVYADGLYNYTVRIPEIAANATYREERAAGLRGMNSIGFRIRDLELVELGETSWEDKFDATDWEPLEISDVTVPADILAMERDWGRNAGFNAERDMVMRFGGGIGIIRRDLFQRADAERKAARAAKEQEVTTLKERIQSTIDSLRGDGEPSISDIVDDLEEIIDMVDEAAYDEMEDERSAESRMGDEEEHESEDEEDEDMDEEERGEERGSVETESARSEPEETAETRAERRRERREEEKVKVKERRSNKYGDRNVNPNPSLSYEEHGLDGIRSVQRMFGLRTGGPAARTKAASREIGWIEAHEEGQPGFDFSYMRSDFTFVMPFEFLTETGLRGQHFGEYERKGKDGQPRARRLKPGPGPNQRAVTSGDVNNNTTGAGAGSISTLVDVPNSMAWLYDTAPILDYIVVDTGVSDFRKVYYGSQNPTFDWVPEAGVATKGNPGLAQIELTPTPLITTYDMSGGLLKSSAINAAELFMSGAENLLWNEVVKAVLSGRNVGAAGANDANAFVGLLNSGIAVTNYGARNAFARSAVVASIDRLVTNLADGQNHVWFMSPGFASLANNTLRGGNASSLYLFERDESIRTGYMEGAPAVITTLLQKTGFTNPAVNLYGSRVLLVIWGPGIEVRMFSPPGSDFVEFGLQVHANMAMVNPLNADGVRETP